MQATRMPRVAADPFRDLFSYSEGGPPSGSLATDLFGQPAASQGTAPAPSGDSGSGGYHGPSGIGGVLAGIAESLGGGGGGANMGGNVGMLGDFDPFQYVESSLAKMQHGSSPGGGGGGGGLGELIGSVARLVGIGG